MHPTIRLAAPLLLSTIIACTNDTQSTEQTSEETAQDPQATLTTNYDPTPLCAAPIDRIEFATRRRNCWDPELPCTIAQDPPWITGTTVDCASISGSITWTVDVMQTGQYETQLRALAGDMQQGVFCFATTGQTRTNVANVDLDTNAELVLVEVADSACSNP